MKKKVVLAVFLVLFIPKYSFAQYSLKDTLKKEFKLKPRLLLGFDNKRSFIGNQGVKIIGIRAGVKYNKLRLFLGMYGTRKPVFFQTINKKDTTFIESSFGYFSAGYEYTFYQKKHWEMVLTGQMGLGGGVKLITKKGITNIEKPGILPAEVGVTFAYYLQDWVAVFAGTGLRVSLYNTSEFDGLFYSIGVKILPGVIYKKYIKKK